MVLRFLDDRTHEKIISSKTVNFNRINFKSSDFFRSREFFCESRDFCKKPVAALLGRHMLKYRALGSRMVERG